MFFLGGVLSFCLPYRIGTQLPWSLYSFMYIPICLFFGLSMYLSTGQGFYKYGQVTSSLVFQIFPLTMAQ